MVKNVLFDLDGTLLPMDHDRFIKKYLDVLTLKLKETPYNAEEIIFALVSGMQTIAKDESGMYTNKETFWRTFTRLYPVDKAVMESVFLDFYENEYSQIKEIVTPNPIIRESVTLLLEKNHNLILATSPVFPEIAVVNRLKWSDLNPVDFSYISSFENSNYAKPSLNYYEDILHKLDLDPGECIMVGNDLHEDGIVEELGIDCYLITDFMINRNNSTRKTKWMGSFTDFHKIIQSSI
ncbi:HAD family hydrolase [Parasporobacterium paucivorans]|uniref:FMN phosphatase YigB, HAD superfamily n=1 Tax=Parasporobacterium paucivorans DSM 15970 TaxID=1122934 RepID=A0A1M6BB74_9FIRM|nr:HAD family hydrolase [Parasporobacterium paucivorans]SHI45979.1 FMN phosphatase YigB, HAD superfamily [Parasporobacterium paucivorans DSM 15970]